MPGGGWSPGGARLAAAVGVGVLLPMIPTAARGDKAGAKAGGRELEVEFVAKWVSIDSDAIDMGRNNWGADVPFKDGIGGTDELLLELD